MNPTSDRHWGLGLGLAVLWAAVLYLGTMWRHIGMGDTALLLVTAGTATTLDIVSPDGLFAGGLILPGITLMMRMRHVRAMAMPDDNTARNDTT